MSPCFAEFNTVLGACEIAGDFMYELKKRITVKSIAYTTSNLIDRGKYYGSVWHNITGEEMYHALGIILKMSIDSP